MSSGEYLAGAVPALATIAACLLAAELVRRRRLGHLAGAPALVAFAVTATAALMAVQLVPGALGLLSPLGTLVAAVVLVAGAWRVPGVPPGPAAQGSPPGPASGRLSWALAIVTGALVAGGILGFVFYESARVVGAIDVLSFHVPGMVASLQEGSLWGVHQYLPRLAHTNYPQNGDLLYLHALAPFGDLTFVRHVFLPWLGLAGLGTYALARELGAPPATGTLAGVAIVALPATAIPAADAGMPDAVMLFAFAAGVLFVLRHARTGRTADLVVAAVALGLSLGTKWYAVTSVAAVVAVWLLARALARHPRAALAREGVLVGGLIALAGGFWLLRNWVLTGNPLFPVRVEVLGLTLFDAPPDRVRALAGFTIADYLGAPDVLRRYVVPGWNATLGGLWLVLGAGVAVAAVPAARLLRGRGRGREGGVTHRAQGARVLALAVLAVLLAVSYALTPYSALGPRGAPVQVAVNARYVVPALLVAAVVVAWALGRLGRPRLVAEALLGVVVVAAGTQAFPPGPTSFAAALALTGGAVAASRAVRRARARGGPGAPRRTALAAALVLGTVAVLGAGWLQAQRFDLSPWRDDRVVAWLLDHPVPQRRVGLAGAWAGGATSPILPAFGTDLADRVAYVGPMAGGMLVEHTDPGAFTADLRRRHLDLLVVGLGYPEPRETVPELGWARAAGFMPVLRSRRLVLLRAPPGR